MKLPKGLTLDTIIAVVEADENIGFCMSCGNDQPGCEPDARKYECESCGAREVYGAQELLITFA